MSTAWAVEYQFPHSDDWHVWEILDSKEEADAEAELLADEFDEPVTTRVSPVDGDEWGL